MTFNKTPVNIIMNILLFGATGRVGEAVLELALSAGNKITVLVRNKTKVKTKHPNLEIVEGDIYDWPLLRRLSKQPIDVIINVIGANPLKPSTLVTDTAKAIVGIFGDQKIRYLAITGIAQMKKTLLGRLSVLLLKLTPVKHAIYDHQNAFQIIKASDFHWSLIGCPYIHDGVTNNQFRKSEIFPGGFKTIHPGDVALAITDEMKLHTNNKIIGVWY